MSPSRPPGLPFAHLNLRWNPFRELPLADWAEIAEVDAAPFVAHLADARTALQFVGEKGYGKTTHLLAIRAQFDSAGYVHLPEGERPPIPTGSPLLIDEGQRLSWRQRHQIFRSDIPLVLGTHRDFNRALRRAGRRVLTFHVEEQTTPERVHRLLNARIQAARRGPGELPHVSHNTTERLLQEHGPNIRAIVQTLYGTLQSMTSVDRI
jgi:hypothetical protein